MRRIIISIGFLVFVSLRIGAQETVDFNTINKETYRLYLAQDWDSVIHLGKHALHHETDFFYLRMRMGIACYSKRNYRAAAHHFSVALEQNQGDPVALEYLYFSRLFSGQTEQAGYTRKQFKGELAKKLPPLKSRFFDQLSVEYLYNAGVDDDIFLNPEEIYPLSTPGIQSTTRHFSNVSLTFTNGLAPGIRLSHALTLLAKSNHFFSNDGSSAFYISGQQVVQYQYYFSPEFTTPSGTTFRPMVHLVRTSSQVPLESGQGFQGGAGMNTVGYPSQTNIATGLGFQKGLGNLDLHLGTYYSNLNQADQVQGRLGMTWFPLGNLNLYTGVYANSQYESFQGTQAILRFVPEAMFGFAIAEKVWIDLRGTLGEMTNYLENKGMIVYNSLNEVIEKKMKISLSIPVTERASLFYLGGVWSSNRSDFIASDRSNNFETNSIYYNALSIYGGLLWKF